MMNVAGPIQNKDEARMLETAAFLTEFRERLRSTRAHLPPMLLPGD